MRLDLERYAIAPFDRIIHSCQFAFKGRKEGWIVFQFGFVLISAHPNDHRQVPWMYVVNTKPVDRRSHAAIVGLSLDPAAEPGDRNSRCYDALHRNDAQRTKLSGPAGDGEAAPIWVRLNGGLGRMGSLNPNRFVRMMLNDCGDSTLDNFGIGVSKWIDETRNLHATLPRLVVFSVTQAIRAYPNGRTGSAGQHDDRTCDVRR